MLTPYNSVAMKQKIKQVNIRIAPFEQVMKETADVMKKIKKGQKVTAEKPTLVFPDIATLNAVLSPERIRLLKTVIREKPQSLNILAKQLNRKYANVFNDIKKLEEFGLISLHEEKNKTEPSVNYENIQIQIPLTIKN